MKIAALDLEAQDNTQLNYEKDYLSTLNIREARESIKIAERFLVVLCPKLAQKFLSAQEKDRFMRTVGLNLADLMRKIPKIPLLQMRE